MKGPFIVSLDLGTSGCRAVAVTTDGQLACEQREAFAPVRGSDGTSHYNAQTLLEVQQRVLNNLLDRVTPCQVAAIAVASQRSTVALWNARTGAAVAPVLTWEDGRAEEEARQADVSQEEVHKLTGLYKTPYFSAPKIAWCLKNLPPTQEAFDAGDLCIGPVATYFIWHLTHGAVFAADGSLAQRTLLFDINSLSWSMPLCRAFGIPKSGLPAVQHSAGDYGIYTYQGVDIPITSCVGDQQAAAYWFDLQPKQSSINYGTGAFWLYQVGQQAVSLPGMLTSVSAQTPQGKNYFLEGPVNAAGSIFLWLNAQGISCAEAELDSLCRLSKNPVRLLPALGGLGAPYFDFSVSPAVENLSPHTQKADWVAGAARGLAFLLVDIAAYLTQQGHELQGAVMAAGGLSHLNYLVGFQADILQRPVHICKDADATVLGAAKLAALGVGWDTQAWKMQTEREMQPHISPQTAAEMYRQWQTFVGRVRAK